jgi:serine/threonine protein kinase
LPPAAGASGPGAGPGADPEHPTKKGTDTPERADQPGGTEGAAPRPEAFGRYQVRRILGSGGFGTVYLGHDTQLDRPVAVKVFRGSRPGKPAASDALLQEARRLAQLHHPGIVAVHDLGVHDGQVYVVSDFVDGPSLEDWLETTSPSWQQAAGLAAAVADALAHAHARSIVHRDVKPANILLAADRTPVLVDFGLALDEARAGGREFGIVSGTPEYMSPEQVTGAAHRIDGRTDIYSLGVALYRMLTGRVPFRAGDTREILRQVREDEPQPPASLSRRFHPRWNGPASRRWRSDSRTATPPRPTSPRTSGGPPRPPPNPEHRRPHVPPRGRRGASDAARPRRQRPHGSMRPSAAR